MNTSLTTMRLTAEDKSNIQSLIGKPIIADTDPPTTATEVVRQCIAVLASMKRKNPGAIYRSSQS